MNADNEKSLAQKYGVSGFPTIKIFTGSKTTPHQGPRTAEAFVEAAIKAAKAKAYENLGKKDSSSDKVMQMLKTNKNNLRKHYHDTLDNSSINNLARNHSSEKVHFPIFLTLQDFKSIFKDYKAKHRIVWNSNRNPAMTSSSIRFQNTSDITTGSSSTLYDKTWKGQAIKTIRPRFISSEHWFRTYKPRPKRP